MGTAGYPRSGGLASVFGEGAKLCSTCQTEVPLTGLPNVACQFLEMPMSPVSLFAISLSNIKWSMLHSEVRYKKYSMSYLLCFYLLSILRNGHVVVSNLMVKSPNRCTSYWISIYAK